MIEDAPEGSFTFARFVPTGAGISVNWLEMETCLLHGRLAITLRAVGLSVANIAQCKGMCLYSCREDMLSKM